MVTAICLIHTESGTVGDAAEGLARLAGVAEVYSVAGGWDLVAIVRVSRETRISPI